MCRYKDVNLANNTFAQNSSNIGEALINRTILITYGNKILEFSSILRKKGARIK